MCKQALRSKAWGSKPRMVNAALAILSIDWSHLPTTTSTVMAACCGPKDACSGAVKNRAGAAKHTDCLLLHVLNRIENVPWDLCKMQNSCFQSASRWRLQCCSSSRSAAVYRVTQDYARRSQSPTLGCDCVQGGTHHERSMSRDGIRR